jgi:hypothetical protein
MVDNDEPARLQALRDLRILDTPHEERFDRVVRLAQRLFDVPMVAVNLIDEDRQWTKAGIGIAGDRPREETFCSRALEANGSLVVEDARSDEQFRCLPAVAGEAGVRFYAGAPLTAPGGQRVGTLCIVDTEPRTLSDLEQRLLEDLAGWVEKELAFHEELLHASEVQRRLLPARLPAVPGFEVAGRCVLAREVGGDFFDWFPVGDQLQFVLADVMGKGIAAAIIAAGVRSVLRGASRFNALEEAVTRAASSLEPDLSETSTFVTAFCGRLDPRNGVLQYVDAGHGLTGILGADGETYRQLGSEGLPIGTLPDDTWTAQVTMLMPGETLVTVSDGVLDFFDSPVEALERVLKENRDAVTAEDLVDRICRIPDGRVAEDDLTVVVVRRTGG